MTYRRASSPPLKRRSHSEFALCHDPVSILGPISPDSTACSPRNFKHCHHIVANRALKLRRVI